MAELPECVKFASNQDLDEKAFVESERDPSCHPHGESRASTESVAPNVNLEPNPGSWSTAESRPWTQDLSHHPPQWFRQVLGLNPFKTSYISLYTPVNDWTSQCVLIGAIVCAIAAGVPLPVIGLIFSRIIDDFPPSEDELRQSIGELLGVAVAYFVVTWVIPFHSPFHRVWCEYDNDISNRGGQSAGE